MAATYMRFSLSGIYISRISSSWTHQGLQSRPSPTQRQLVSALRPHLTLLEAIKTLASDYKGERKIL
jgi:hypothetical protein